MASIGGTFHPEDAPEPDGEFAPLPAGDYMAQIVESDVKDTKTGDGKRLNLQLEIMSGPYANRKVFDGLNISNPSAQAQGIALRQLAAITTALGLPSIDDSEELHFKPLMIRLKVKNDPAYGPKNEVSRYMPVGGGRASAPPADKATPRGDARSTGNGGSAASSPPPTQGGSNRPWKRPGAAA